MGELNVWSANADSSILVANTLGITRVDFLASSGQTVFNLPAGVAYSPSVISMLVYVNGQLQEVGASADYLETSTVSFTFNSARVLGEKVTCLIGIALNSIDTLVATSVFLGSGETLQNYLSNRYTNIKDVGYGAIGNGITVDYDAFQTAISALNSGGGDERQILWLPKGTYNLGGNTLEIPRSGLHVVSEGAVLITTGDNPIIRSGTPGSTLYDITFENVIFVTEETSDTHTDALVDFRGISRFLFNRCAWRTNGNNALYVGTRSPGDGSLEWGLEYSRINLQVNGYGIGIRMEDSVMTTGTIRKNKFTYGDEQILLCNSGGTAAGTVITNNVFELGDVCIRIPTDGAKNVSVTDNYAESYDEAFISSASPVKWENNRQSSPGAIIMDISTYLPDLRIANQDEYNGGVLPIPNFPGNNILVNSDFTLWGYDDGTHKLPFGLTAGAFSGVTWSQEATIKLTGTYSLKVVPTAVNKDVYYYIIDESLLAKMRGHRVYFCSWVYSDVANNAQLRIYDGVGAAASLSPQYHPGGGKFLYLVASKIIDASATYVQLGWRNSVATGTYYIDCAMASIESPVSLYPMPTAKDSNNYTAQSISSIDLSGAAASLDVFHNNTGRDMYLLTATLLYTEASSADAGVTVKIGKESDDDYFYTGTSEVSKAKYYSLDVTLLKRLLASGDTLTFGCVGGKVGTGEVRLIVSYLLN